VGRPSTAGWFLWALAAAACDTDVASDGGRRTAVPSPPLVAQIAARRERAPERAVRRGPALARAQVLVGGARPGDELPLVVALHGRGGRASAFARLFRDLSIPARIVALEGPHTVDHGSAWLSVRAHNGPEATVVRDLAALVPVVADEIAALRREFPTRGEPIVVGFSQGGMLAYALAVHRPELVSHAVVVGGYLPDALLPRPRDPGSQAPRITALHGRWDVVIRKHRAERTAQALADRGYAPQLRIQAGSGHHFEHGLRRRTFEVVHALLRRQHGLPAQPEPLLASR
jgi:phospholipase/carboxylesterase